LTLGGGIGYCSRYLGLACDALAGARVVTSSGAVLVANAEENADLFWVSFPCFRTLHCLLWHHDNITILIRTRRCVVAAEISASLPNFYFLLPLSQAAFLLPS